MTARANIRADDLAELLINTTGPLDLVAPDVSLRCWFALNTADPATAQATLAEVAEHGGAELAADIVTRMTQALDDHPEGFPV